MRRTRISTRTAAGLAALVVLTALTACVPRFPGGSTLTATPTGSGAELSWPTATDSDPGGHPAHYRIDVDGTEVSRFTATRRTCTLTGLDAGPHEITVTAYDNSGEWSGGDAAGRLTATVTAPTPATPAAPTCTPPALVRHTDTPEAKYAPSISGDGRILAYGFRNSDLVGGSAVIDRSTGVVTTLSSGDRIGGGPKVSDDGEWVAFTSAATNVVPGQASGPERAAYLWERATGTFTRISPPGQRVDRELDITGDGGTVVYAVEQYDDGRDDDVVAWDRATGTTSSISDLGGNATIWDLTPDGRFLVFAQGTATEGTPRLRVLDRQDGTSDVLALGGTYGWASASDDGAHVVFHNAGYPASVFVWDRGAGPPVRLTPDPEVGGYPSISGDGRWILYYARKAAGAIGWWLLDRTQGTTTLVTDLRLGEGSDLSRDGQVATFILQPQDQASPLQVHSWERPAG